MRSKTILAVVVAAAALTATGVAAAKAGGGQENSAFVGVPVGLTGATNMQRGLAGGGLPWVIGRAESEVKASGKVEVEFNGLVIDPNDANAQARGLAGVNPIPAMKVIVSCVTATGATMNVSTPTFPVTADGNGSTEAEVALPSPCLEPVVFITSPGNAWFATSGF